LFNFLQTSASESGLVLGEVTAFSGLKSDVARGMSVPLTFGQVIKQGVSINTKSVNPGSVAAYAASIGAAIRVALVDEVNFLPKENRLRLEKNAFAEYMKMKLRQFTNINVFVLILLVVLSGFLWFTQMAYANNIAQTERFVSNHPAQKYVPHITSINTLAQQVSNLMRNQEDVGARLVYLSSVTPPKISFTSLKMVSGTREEWAIAGTGNRSDILAFYYKLKVDGKVKDVTMPYTNFDRETGSPFTLMIVW